MDRDLAPCLECGADVPETAAACPACGYDVARHDRPRLLFGGIGMALSLTLVLAPLGLPLLWRAHRHRLAADGTVTSRASTSVREEFAATLRSHLDVTPPSAPSGDFLRGRGSPEGRTVSHWPR